MFSLNSSVKIHLEPLAVAANILQSSDTRLDTTLLTWGNLYRIYSDPALDDAVRAQVLNSLSKRWLQMDQDAFISAVIMNPYVHGKGFACGNSLLSPVGLYNIAKRTCERMLRMHLGLEFHSAFFDYLMESNEFSSSLMGLTEWKQLCEQEVRTFTQCCGDLVLSCLFPANKCQSRAALGTTRHRRFIWSQHSRQLCSPYPQHCDQQC